MARLLRIPEAHGVGIYVTLTAWALDLAPDGDLSGRLEDADPAALVAAAVGWDGDAGALLVAMERTRVIMRDASGTHAVAGLDVYERALTSSEGRKVAASVAARARWDGKRDASRMPDASPSHGDAMRPDAKTQTQTQTQTQKAEDLPPASQAAPEQHPLLPTEPPSPAKKAKEAKKPREPTGDPRHAPLSLALVGLGWPHHGGRTAKALKSLLALSDQVPATSGDKAQAEVLRRAAAARASTKFPLVRELHELAERWGHFAAPAEPPRPSILPRADDPEWETV